MPVYYFHLGSGDRVLSDDQGIELRDRFAAREEGRAIIHDLSKHAAGPDLRRWDHWFLLIADADGAFLRLPLAHAGVVVASRVPASSTEQLIPNGNVRAAPSAPAGRTLVALIRQMLDRRQTTSQLLDRQRGLREELAGQFSLSEAVRDHAAQVLALARLVTSASARGEVCETAVPSERPARPHLVVLPGGKA
jgi:Domain of unknown function (DUF6894)